MKTIGIIAAMEEEISQIKAEMKDVILTERAGMQFAKGSLYGRSIVAVRSGIGKVQAAICTQMLIDLFEVDAVINTGIAGGLKSGISIGDIVLSEDAIQHDVDAQGFGYPPGQIPRLDRLSFVADERLIRLAKKVCKEVNPEIEVHRGRVLSGDQFISDREVKARLIRLFDGSCAEMEGGAIAQCAYLNQVPFLIIRAISDQADDGATVDYATFEAQAILHSVKLVKGMLAAWDMVSE